MIILNHPENQRDNFTNFMLSNSKHLYCISKYRQMKTITTTLILLLSVSLSAQDFSYGVGGGVDFIYYRDNTDSDIVKTTQTGYNLNFYMAYKFSEKIGMSGELGYMNKKYNDVLRVPIMLDIYPSERVFVSVGPELAFGFDNELEPFEFSGLVGLTGRVTNRIDIGGRFVYGFTPFWKVPLTNEQNVVTETLKAHLNYLDFFVRYRFK